LFNPPGTNSHINACRRHAVLLNDRASRVCRRDNNRKIVAWSSRRTTIGDRVCNAANATEYASFGPFLLDFPEHDVGTAAGTPDPKMQAAALSSNHATAGSGGPTTR
jgi:hypothetical protein